MANLTATSAWSDVLQLETTHQAIGGAGGTMNLQAQSLINRTQYLADNKLNTADFLTTLKTNLNASGSAPVYSCRAWVNFKGIDTVAINASGNVLSITDNGTGDYTINFDKPMPHANYCLVGTASQGSTASGVTSANNVTEYKSTSTSLALKTINAVRIATVDNNQDSFFDSFSANVAIFC